MTTSEQARAWAKAEASQHYVHQGSVTSEEVAAFAFAAGILHVLSLLESETAVEAVQDRVYDDYREGDKPVIRAALAAAVAAITKGGSENG